MWRPLTRLKRPLHIFGLRLLNRWSALEATFNSHPKTHNASASKSSAGLFLDSRLTCAEGFEDLTRDCIQHANKLISEALTPYNLRRRKMVEVFDELSDTLCKVADLAEFVRFAHPNSHYSQQAERASVALSGIVEKLNTNLDLYEAMRLARDAEPHQTEMDQLVTDLFLFDFQQSGIHLTQEKRQQAVQLNDIVLRLGQEFVSGVARSQHVPKSSVPAELHDIFPSHGNNGETLVVAGLYSDSPDARVRQLAYKIYLQPERRQEALLNQLLACRNQLAITCGFTSYAERTLRGTILQTPTNVMDFLDKVSTKIEKQARQDFKQMAQINNCVDSIPIWDVPFVSQKARRQMKSSELSAYFPLGACIEGLNEIFQCLYGVSLVSSELMTNETWSPDVYKLSVVHEIEGCLGHIYCDFYERPNKPNQDCHFTIRGGKKQSNGDYQLPIVVLMLNLPAPRWGAHPSAFKPTLLTPSQLDNLFHEMGHAMHSMLARTQYQHISGTRCSTDLAEVPSILMEYFASDERVLKQFARHFQTQERITDDQLKHLCASKKLFNASETQLQVFYAVLDQIYHGKHPLHGTTTQILERTQSQYYALPYVPGTTWQLRFSHLVGYGAKYYSYLVSRALAHFIWKMYFEDDPLNRQQGERFRRQFLAFGGGKEPSQLVSDFLHVDVTPEMLSNSILCEIEQIQQTVQQLESDYR